MPLQVVPLGTRQVGEVICTIDNPDLTLIPGTNINAEIRSKVAENALAVPKEVTPAARLGDRRVSSWTAMKLVWRPVRTGSPASLGCRSLEGLKEGDQVALPVETTDQSRRRSQGCVTP